MSEFYLESFDLEAEIKSMSIDRSKIIYRFCTRMFRSIIEVKRNKFSLKMISIETNWILDNDLDYIPFKFFSKIPTQRNERLSFSSYFVIFFNHTLAFKGKVFSGEYRNWVYEKLKDKVFIGQAINGVKSGFGHLKTPNFEYIGNFHQNHFSGKGKKIVKNVEYKGNFVLSKLIGEVIRKEGREKIKYYQDEDSDDYLSQYTITNFTEKQDLYKDRRKNLKTIQKSGLNWLVFPSGSQTPVLENMPWYKLDSILSTNSNSDSLTTIPGNNPEKKLVLFKNGEKYNGNLVNNQLNGFGKYFYSNGMVYIGEFFNGQRHGIGTMFKDSQKIVKGQWVKNILQGQARVYKSTEILNCFFINGKITSVVRSIQLTYAK